MWPPQTRIVLLVAGIPLLLAGAAEAAYRIKFRRELASLEYSIDSQHAFRSRRVELSRFGLYAPGVEPSLGEDLLEGLRLRFARPSRLNGGDRPKPWLNGYYAVHFTMQHSDDSWPPNACHVFIWSPRKLRFVHYLTEGECPEFPGGSCPWRSNPRANR